MNEKYFDKNKIFLTKIFQADTSLVQSRPTDVIPVTSSGEMIAGFYMFISDIKYSYLTPGGEFYVEIGSTSSIPTNKYL